MASPTWNWRDEASRKEASRVMARAAAGTSAAQNGGTTVSQLLSTLLPVLIVAIVWGILFLLFRTRFKRNYQPRTFLGSLRPEQRTPKVSDKLIGWIGEFWSIPDTFVLNHHSLDAYLFLRFLKITIIICFVGCCITWPVLFPINATGGNGYKQLDILSFSNVANYWKWFAHCVIAMIFFSFVMYMITRESVFFINLRQAYLMSPLYASRISSRTVLFTSVPADYMNEAKLRAMLGNGVRRVWLATNTKELEDKVQQRDKAAMKLEGAETKLIVAANKAHLKAQKKNGGELNASEEAAIGEESIAMRYLKPKQRPTHKLGFLGLIGKKVDTIDWSRAELKKLIPEVDRDQAVHKAHDARMLNSAFVEFNTLIEAQAAYQSLAHHQALHMSPRFAGVTPHEVVWKNLRLIWWERVIRRITTLSFVVALIIFWSIPVAAIGAISNINQLESTKGFHWVGTIFNALPTQIAGVVTGLLPTIMLAVLMALLPIILRAMAKLGGDPTLSAVELTVQNWYFAFQVIDVFGVTTIGSAASSVAGSIAKQPSSAVSLLAQKLPNASNFYISYFVLQGLAVVSGTLVGLAGLVIFILLGKILDKTPRKMYKRWTTLSSLGWGTVMPIYSNLCVIALCYAAIAPLVLGFATIGLSLFYFAFRYNMFFVNNAQIDTKGRMYPRALQHLFVGIYVAEICLVGLFAIGTGSQVGAIGPLVLMILFVVFTALYQISLNSALGPLLDYLPKSIDAEERRLLAAEHGGHVNGYEEDSVDKEGRIDGQANTVDTPAPHKKPNFFTKWLRPDKYQDYETMRRLVPKDIAIDYSAEDEVNAFYNPAISSPAPLLWIPRDQLGISRQEVRDTEKVIPITDEGAYLDDKGKVIWDAQDGRPPINQEVPYY
ncbi:DUF221-domain-containing protein [Teratosphaeria nubilosa]|uniref:DUF221-domain-containing protein n=1 Tax=Teratosphaeria nubilosa TaxID=161662 RepID=A0A6G1LJH8_9PEZI|nr:DUF221-domain-containing protein [Teratosphaeria nubilosa]